MSEVTHETLLDDLHEQVRREARERISALIASVAMKDATDE